MNHSLEPMYFSRRRYLQVAGLAAASAAMGWADESSPGYIDAHVHVWTSDTAAYPLGKDYDKTAMRPPSFTAEELFEHCRPAGVKRVVLIQMSFYQFDNRYMLDTIANDPETFRGVAIIDHEQTDTAETMRALKGQGVTGFRLYADAKSAKDWLDSASISRMWKAAAQTDQAICLLANPDAIPFIERLCRKFPETRVVIDHFARIGMSGKIDSQALDNLCQLATLPHIYVKTSAFYALGKKAPPYTDLAPMVRRLYDSFGPRRLMWASDCPYQVQNEHSYAASISLIRDRLDFLTVEDKTWLLRKTAESVYWS